MADPFAAGLSALYGAGASVAAYYTPPGGAAIPLRTIHEQPGAIIAGDLPEIVVDTHRFHLRVADVGEPEVGGTIELAASGDRYTISGDALTDSEGVSWSCPAEPEA